MPPAMNNPYEVPTALKALQDDIYRGKILRTRKQTPAEPLADVFELTNVVFDSMHAGAMWQLGIEDPDKGWQIVRQRLNRLQKLHNRERFVHQNPAPSHDC